MASLALATAFVSKSIFNSEENDFPNTDHNGDDDYAPTYCFMAKGAKDDQPKYTEWLLDNGCTNHMTGDRNLLMDTDLSPLHLKHITYADKGKSKVLGLGCNLKGSTYGQSHACRVLRVQPHVCLNAL